MPDRTQEIKNLRAVAVASKNYIDKRIDDLQWQLGTYDLGVESDNTSALVKTMPNGTIMLNVNKIYGASEVSENLIVLDDVEETTANGITWKVKNGVVTLGGTATATTYVFLHFSRPVPIGTYSYNQFVKKTGHNVYLAPANSGQNIQLLLSSGNTGGSETNITTQYEMNYLYFYISSGAEITNYSFIPMLVKGSTAPTDFKVGYTGIHNLELSGLKVEGYNKAGLVDVAETTGTNSVTYKVQDNIISFKGTNSASVSSGILIALKNSIPAGTYSIGLFNNAFDTTQDVRLRFNYSDSSIKDLYINNANYSNNNVVLEKEVVSLYIRLGTFSNSSWVEFKVTLVLGTTAPTTFVPYIAPTTLSIDLTTIEDSNNNKLFPNGKLMGYNGLKDVLGVYNQTSKWDETIFNGSETWYKNDAWSSENNIAMYTSISGAIYNSLNVVLDKDFTPVPNSTTSTTIDQLRIATNVIYLNFTAGGGKISEFTLEKAKQWLANNPLTVQFERATHLTSNTDLSATLRNIQGYPNGSIIAENTNNMDVSSEIDYLVEEVKA